MKHQGGGPAGDEGFTLIELLIVIVILGVLATVVVFAVGGITDRGEAAALDSDERTVIGAEEAYYAINAIYATEAELVIGGFLRDESTIHDVTLAVDGSSYTLGAEGTGGGGPPPSPTTLPASSTTTPPATTLPPGPVAASFAGFTGQAVGSGSLELVIIGNSTSGSTAALFNSLTATPLPNTTVIWLDQADINDTNDVITVLAAGPTYTVAADMVPITRTFSPFGTTYVGQYMDGLPGMNSPANFWWTHDEGRNPTYAELAAILGV